MGSSQAAELKEYHEKFYEEFSDYHDRVESAFLDGEELTGPELHRGKHFLAHGMVDQFRAKQELISAVEGTGDGLPDYLDRLHQQCVRLIRDLHDSVNQLANPNATEEERRREPRRILRLLHKLDTMLEVVFEIEEQEVYGQALSDLPPEQHEQFFQELDHALNQNTGCPSQGQHKMQ